MLVLGMVLKKLNPKDELSEMVLEFLELASRN